MRFQLIIIKYTAGLTASQLLIIEIIKDLRKNNLNNFIADLSNNTKKKFFISFSDNKTNTVIVLSYLSISRIMLSSLLRLSQKKALK